MYVCARVWCCCRSKSKPKRCFTLLGIPVEAEPRRSAARVPGNRLGRWAEGGRAAARAAAAEGTHRSSGADPGWGTRGAPGSGTPGSLEGTGPRTLAAGACLDRSSEDNLAVRFGGEREAKRERGEEEKRRRRESVAESLRAMSRAKRRRQVVTSRTRIQEAAAAGLHLRSTLGISAVLRTVWTWRGGSEAASLSA